MLRVKQLLTEVLLDVTNSEIADIARLVFTSAWAKQARGSTSPHHTTIVHSYIVIAPYCVVGC